MVLDNAETTALSLDLPGQIQPLDKQESHNYLYWGVFPVVSQYFRAAALSFQH